MRARFESWRHDLALGMWIFSKRSGSSAWSADLPREIVYHILAYLRVARFACRFCGSEYRITIHVDMNIDVYVMQWPQDLCAALGRLQCTPKQATFLDFASLYPSIMRPLVLDRAFTIPVLHHGFAPQPQPHEEPLGIKPAQLRAHFVAQEREQERERRRSYWPAGKGHKRK